uniref:Integral membrane protein n=1 Tax=Mycena chlorophos TaxID=658473 RepID=A0ABQ0L811_MYCCL|nr:predicted protein [Mycena chlorophos]
MSTTTTTPPEDPESQQTHANNTAAGRWHLDLHPDVKQHSPHGAFSFLHPTHAVLALSSEKNLAWTSRDHRKHRHVAANPQTGQPRHVDGTLRKLWNFRRIEYWNISWWVAMLFTVGSIVWVINGFFSFLPFVQPSALNSKAAIGWSAWVGATIFEFGALAGLLEAWNREDAADFGWNVHSLLHGGKEDSNGNDQAPRRKWIWFSGDRKYFHELGFLAAFIQYLAATIFWISGFTGLPEIQNSISSNVGVLDGIFWTPQVVGGTGFIIASALMMIETQRKWYVPAPLSLGWHVGFWNFVGGVGFTLCGAFGYAMTAHGMAYQSSCSTFWGGWAFLIGSVIQWYEAVNPVTDATT